MSADATYPSTFQVRQDGNAVVPSGASLDIESGGALKIAGSTVTPTATQLNQYVVTAYAADIGTAGSSFVTCPHAGVIKSLQAVNHGANAGTKTVLTAKIATVSVTAPAWEVAVTAAAGIGVAVVPTATNTVTAGAVLEIAYDGGSSNVTPATFSIVIER